MKGKARSRRGGGKAKRQRQGFVLPLALRFSFMTAFPGAPKALCSCASGIRVYLKTQNCTKRQEKDIKGFYHRQYKEVIA